MFKMSVSINFHSLFFITLTEIQLLASNPAHPQCFLAFLLEGPEMEQLKKQGHLPPKNLHFGIHGNAPDFRCSHLSLLCHENF